MSYVYLDKFVSGVLMKDTQIDISEEVLDISIMKSVVDPGVLFILKDNLLVKPGHDDIVVLCSVFWSTCISLILYNDTAAHQHHLIKDIMDTIEDTMDDKYMPVIFKSDISVELVNIIVLLRTHLEEVLINKMSRYVVRYTMSNSVNIHDMLGSFYLIKEEVLHSANNVYLKHTLWLKLYRRMV